MWIHVCIFLSMINLGSSLGNVHQDHRNPFFEKLWVYQPETLVTDHAAIDLDLHTIKQQLALRTSTGFSSAVKIYQEGGHSRSFARFTLIEPLKRDIPKGTVVQGLAHQIVDGQEAQRVLGKVFKGSQVGDSEISILYATNHIQESYVGCQVGGSASPNFDGCFASSGTLYLPDIGASFEYYYNITTDNLNDRTIHRFSAAANETMAHCEECPYPDFTKFHKYYGKANYGNHIISSALSGKSTHMSSGNMDFSIYGMNGTVEVFQKTLAYMNVWMWIVREMEHAIDSCVDECQGENCSDASLHAWDSAVAYYTGSRRRTTNTAGDLLYHLAEKRCTGFKTCGHNGDESSGTAFVNHAIFNHFKNGQMRLKVGDCDGVHTDKERIVTMMTVPLIQGTLRYAYLIANSASYDEKYSSQGAAFALSVLPFVHACSEEDAFIIHDQMKPSHNAQADFNAVKEAFERNYLCMNLQCRHVGGVYNQTLEWYDPGAHPCFVPDPTKKKNTQIFGIVVGSTTLVGLVGILLVCLPAKKGRSEAEKAAQEKSSLVSVVDIPELA